MSRLHKETLRRLMEASWNQRNLSVVDETIASDYVRHDPSPGEVRGPGGLKQSVR